MSKNIYKNTDISKYTNGNRIFITDETKLELFEQLHEEEMNGNKYMFEFYLSAEHLERICLGSTGQCDKAYGSIRRKLKAEYLEWKEKQNG